MNEYGTTHEDLGRSDRTGLLSTLTQERRWRFLDSMEGALGSFGPAERLALYVLGGMLGVSAFVLVFGASTLATVSVPARGGTLVEGEVGSARFINPLLMLSQPDQDITALVYSGLMRANPDGTFTPDLAESYTISGDGRIYTFKLRRNVTFHDGRSVRAADVVFTIEKAVDPAMNSPRRADWMGVSVTSPDEGTVVFTLPHAYAPFLQNTTLGILPKHLWENVSPDEFPFSPLNTHPVGSGPYKIDKLSTDATGAPKRYDLKAFVNYALGSPFLSRISFIFYDDTSALIKALNAGHIDAASGVSPADVAAIKRNDLNVAEVPLPRVFGVFFNQSHNTALGESNVRRALEAAVDKNELIQAILKGRGQVLSGPTPPKPQRGSSPSALQSLTRTSHTSTTGTSPNTLENVQDILISGGWKFEPSQAGTASSTGAGSWTKQSNSGASATKKTLAFTLATADQPELAATGRALVEAWQKAGIQAELHVYPLSELNATVIRPRSYDALLFGEVVGPELDLYAFWHSSQRNDPGLNLALYANPATDALLSEARGTTDANKRSELYAQFATLLMKDTPAIFLYAPNFLYVVPDSVHGITLGSLSTPADRFESAREWYVSSERVWTIFTNNN